MSPLRRPVGGPGRFDEALRDALRAEGVLFWAEDLRGEVFYHRDYRAWGDLVADGIRYLERGCDATVTRRATPEGPGTVRRVTVDVAVSEGWFVLWVGGGKFIDLPRVDGRPEGVTARLVEPDRVEVRVLARRVEPGVGRHIAVVITTTTAVELAELLVGDPPSR